MRPVPIATERRGARRELVALLQRIQALTLELHELRRGEESNSDELDAKEHMLEQLRWRLAVVARRDAIDDLGAAA
jgi:hypothetical protein